MPMEKVYTTFIAFTTTGLAILRIIGEWNSFVGPLLYLRDSKLQAIAVATPISYFSSPNL